MKFPQVNYDVQQNVGGGQLEVRRVVMNNPPDSPFLPTADDYGCYAWTCDPADVTTAAQLTVSETLYGSLLVIPNSVTVNRFSFVPHTVQGTETNFNGVGLYSVNSAFTTATLVVASANQTWTGVTPDVATDAAFTATSGTAMSLHGELGTVAAVMNFSKNSAVSKYRSFTLATQATLPATITLSATTADAFVPFMALS
jgi:hypothetical protein